MSKAKLQTVEGLKKEAVALLRNAGIDSASLDADVLLSHVLKRDKAYLLSHGDDPAPQGMEQTFAKSLARRMKGEPVAYITGTREFYGLEFAVNRHVLIPRPKTEEMVERAKGILSWWSLAETLVIDVGTGSGILAITVKKLFPSVTVLAVDHSKRALKVARENAKGHGFRVINLSTYQVIKDRDGVYLLHSDLLSKVGDLPFDNILILANLPYIPTREILTLEKDVKDFEPEKALDGGEDGLDLFRRLAKQVRRKFPGKNVKVLWECEEGQEVSVKSLFRD